MPRRIKPKDPLSGYLFLSEWRTEKRLTQQELADKLGVSDVTISRYETGERRPDIPAQAAIAEKLGIDIMDLRRDPSQPSADALLRQKSPEVAAGIMKLIEQPPEVIARVLALVEALRK